MTGGQARIPRPRDPRVYSVCGIPITAIAPRDAAELLAVRAVAGGALQAHLCNAYTLALADTDSCLRSALLVSDLNLPDGTPVAWLGRRHGIYGPVRGPGLVGDVALAGVPLGLRHYLYGGAEGTAAAMADRLRTHASGVVIVGWESPPFRTATEEELDDVAERIMACGAHLVWVGLGTPRQDYLVPQLASRLPLAVVPVGAAFDYWAGTVKQAPHRLHGSGLEWAYRFAVEPRRLWRRYVFGNPRFVASVVRHRRHEVPGARP